jgi:hypothetical protein
MRQLIALTLALALGAAAAFALASCGGEDAKLLPGSTAAEISENLDVVQRLASEGECVGAADAADQVSAQVEALEGVDPKLKQALERGAARLDEVVTTCEEAETETVAPSREATEETKKTPPGQEKKREREREREESEAEKNVPTTPNETTPAEPPGETTPSEEGGGTSAPGGVSPASPAPEGE